jgi:hypothetical protein
VSTLETRYRRMLMLLPAAYRERRGEEMLGTLLDGAEPGRRRPRMDEVASLAALAVRLRMGAPGGSRRSVVTGEVARRVTLVGLFGLGLWFCAVGVSGATLMLSLPYWNAFEVLGPLTSGSVVFGVCLPLLLLGGYVALVLGHRRLGRSLAIVQAPSVVVQLLVLKRYGVFPEEVALITMSVMVGAAAVLGFHRGAPKIPAPRKWLTVAAVGILVVSPMAVLDTYPNPFGLGPHVAYSLSQITFAVVAPLLVIGFGVLRARRSALWPTVLFVAGLPTLTLLPHNLAPFVGNRIVNVYAENWSSNLLLSGLDGLVAETVLAAAVLWALHRRRAAARVIEA